MNDDGAKRLTRRLFNWAVLVFIASTAVICYWRTPPKIDEEFAFWANKISKTNSDVVLAGDSRTMIGLDPGSMGSVLPGRIFNFGFNGAAYERRYLDAIGSALDPNSSRPTIVLGISPHSLTPAAALHNQFLETNEHRLEVSLEIQIYLLLSFFQPLSRPASPPQKQRFLHDNGWAEHTEDHLDPKMELEVVEKYKNSQFVNNPCSQPMQDTLLQQVAQWRHKGIRVIAFRHPTSVAMLDVERDCCDFHEAALKAKIQANGGTWLEVDRAEYETYDGSHLTSQSARAISVDLGAKIATTSGP